VQARIGPVVLLMALIASCRGGGDGAPPVVANASGSPAATSAAAPATTPRSPAPASELAPQPAEPAPRFEGSVDPIDAELRARLVGRNWRPGCPVAIRDLRVVDVSHRNFRGEVRHGPLVLHENVAHDVLWVFRRIFRAGFEIHRIGLPPPYRPPRPGDRDNTRNLSSSFNCRPATGNPGSVSEHSYGWAVDINPVRNPYVRADGSVLRDAVKPYLDRTRRAPGMIHAGDIVVRSFARIGWEWGGHWTTIKDYMHFSLTGA
jgi:hypothetical protein